MKVRVALLLLLLVSEYIFAPRIIQHPELMMRILYKSFGTVKLI